MAGNDPMTISSEGIGSLLQVVGGSVVSHGLTVREDFYVAVEEDPWFHIEAERPSRFVVLSIRFPQGYLGDIFSVYFSVLSNPGFSERRVIHVETRGKTFLTRVIAFDEPIHAIRIDPAENEAHTGISFISISLASSEVEAVRCLCGRDDSVLKCLVVTHDLTKTGAPLLACRISEELQNRGWKVVALCASQKGEGLESSYWDKGIPLLELDALCEVFAGSFEKPCRILDNKLILPLLANNGYGFALLNTVVSAQYSEAFKQAGVKVVSLIHETSETIAIHGMDDLSQKAAAFSDILVFPSKSIADGFRHLVGDVKGDVMVRPQGVYLPEDCASDRDASDLLETIGIPANAIIVLGAGTPEFRKGYDLFVAEAIILKELLPGRAIHFIWAGRPQEDMASQEYLKRLSGQIEKSSVAQAFHFIEFLEPSLYSSLLDKADVFWCTSRDDTFPSAVLEAMQRQIPVVAYEGTGGVDIMLAEERGWLLPKFSLTAYAEQTRCLLTVRNGGVMKRLENAQRWVREELNFSNYVEWLSSLMRQ